MERVKDLFAQSRIRLAGIVVLLIIALAVPITLRLVSQQQDLRQRAAGSLATCRAACEDSCKNFSNPSWCLNPCLNACAGSGNPDTGGSTEDNECQGGTNKQIGEQCYGNCNCASGFCDAKSGQNRRCAEKPDTSSSNSAFSCTLSMSQTLSAGDLKAVVNKPTGDTTDYNRIRWTLKKGQATVRDDYTVANPSTSKSHTFNNIQEGKYTVIVQYYPDNQSRPAVLCGQMGITVTDSTADVDRGDKNTCPETSHSEYRKTSRCSSGCEEKITCQYNGKEQDLGTYCASADKCNTSSDPSSGGGSGSGTGGSGGSGSGNPAGGTNSCTTDGECVINYGPNYHCTYMNETPYFTCKIDSGSGGSGGSGNGSGGGSTAPTDTPTPTTDPNALAVDLKLQMPGIGQAVGDNNAPERVERDVTVRVFNSSNDVSTISGKVTFDGTDTYTGVIDLSSIAEAGIYYLKAGFDNTLISRISGVVELIKGEVANSSLTTLIPGDLDQNNILNITDYNIFKSCYGAASCTQKDLADFNDNGSVEPVDYNILLRSFAIIAGD